MNNYKRKITAFLRGNNFSSAVLTVIVIAAVVFVNIIAHALTTVFINNREIKVQDDLSISSASDVLFEKYINDGRSVTVTFCSYENDVAKHDTGSFVYRTAKEFEKRYPGFIKLRFINAVTKLDSNGNSVSDELATYLDDGKNRINDTSVIFSTETSYRVLTDYYSGTGYVDFFTLDDSLNITSYNGEETFASSVLWALNENHGTAYMTVGHGESANGTLYNILTSAGYNVKELDLRKNDVPEDAELVIISNPIFDFERGAENSSLITEYDRLVSYRNNGGKFIVFFEPLAKKLTVLEGFIGEFGISFSSIDSGERAIVKDSNNAITTDGFTLVAEFDDNSEAQKLQDVIRLRSGDNDGRVILRNMSAINFREEKHLTLTPILVSSSSSVLEAGGETIDSVGEYTIAAYSKYANDLQDPSGMLVMCDGMLTAGDAIVTDGYSNKDFLYSVFDKIFGKGEMPYGCRSIIYNESILENLTMGSARVYTILIMAIPVLITLLATVILVRRKNR